MSNQNNSPSPPGSSGPTTSLKPLDFVWQQLVQVNEQTGHYPLHLQELMKYTFMQGATASYNLLINALRQDPSMLVMANVSADMLREINEYFETALAQAESKQSSQH